MLAVHKIDYTPDDWPEPDFDSPEAELRHDPKVDQASDKLLAFIESNPGEVFYEMQLEVLFEDDYFHWITTKALAQLRDSHKIGSSIEVLTGRSHPFLLPHQEQILETKGRRNQKVGRTILRSCFHQRPRQSG